MVVDDFEQIFWFVVEEESVVEQTHGGSHFFFLCAEFFHNVKTVVNVDELHATESCSVVQLVWDFYCVVSIFFRVFLEPKYVGFWFVWRFQKRKKMIPLVWMYYFFYSGKTVANSLKIYVISAVAIDNIKVFVKINFFDFEQKSSSLRTCLVLLYSMFFGNANWCGKRIVRKKKLLQKNHYVI